MDGYIKNIMQMLFYYILKMLQNHFFKAFGTIIQT